jgi:hypothetical protein
MLYKKGDRVKHLNKQDWGIGEVLEDSKGDFIDIFFVNVGKKQLSLKIAALEKIKGNKSDNQLLDNLIKSNFSNKEFKSMDEAITDFHNLFPKGFYEDEYINDEREYKVSAHKLIVELLNEENYSKLIYTHSYDEIVKNALRVVNKTNLIFPNEKMSLKDGLESDTNKRIFSETLYNLLFNDATFEERFNKFTHGLEELDAGKWTIATYFPFLMFPKEHIFLKPTITQHAANICGFEINYSPQLNWLTYKSVLEFANYLGKSIEKEKPRDMIDIQSFMWCITPGKY